jgi:FdhD protein
VQAGPSTTVRRRVHRWPAVGSSRQAIDDLAVEEPLEIQVDTRPFVVTMRTPGHDEELAAGFLLGEGVVRVPSDIARVGRHPRNRFGNVLQIFLSGGADFDLKRVARNTYASSSCGLCGKTSIAAIHQSFPKVKTRLTVSSKALQTAAENLRAAQATFSRTGGIHAAAICNPDGTFVVVREDIGRHNAVDKVLGYGLLENRLPFDRHFLLVSGRASFEIVQKALAARIPLVAAVSAPSSLAVEFAARSGMTLVGFLRDQRMNVYSHAARIRAGKR